VVVQGGSYGSSTSTFFRGAESDHVKVLVDGVEMNQAGGTFDFSGLSMADVERIEVLRGPASAFYGSDAMAGVIHIITRRGRGPLKGTFSLGGGSYGRVNWVADVDGATGPVGYALSFARETTDGILEFNNEFENTVLSAKAFARLRERTQLELSGRYSDRTYHFPTDISGKPVDRNAFTFGEEWSLNVQAGHMVSDRIELLATAQAYRWYGGSDDRPDSPADTLGYYGYVADDVFRRTSGDVRANLTPWNGLVLSAGFELEQEQQDSESISYTQWGPSSGEDRYERWNRAYYAHLLSELGGWAGNLGVRVDDNEQYGDFFTYQAGLSYLVSAAGTRIRGNLGRGLKAPTFLETSSSGFSVGNPELDPERSQVWELGLEQPMGETGVTASLTWFHQSLEDFIEFTFLPPEPGGPNYFNVARARTRGLEAAVSALVGGAWVAGTYTYLDSEVVDAGFDEGDGAIFVEGEPLIRRPKHQGNLRVLYAFDRGSVSADVRWTGSRYDRDFSAFPATPVELAAHTLLGFGAEFGVLDSKGGRPDVDLRFRAENLLDEKYQEQSGFEAPGRAFLFGVKLGIGG
jgi:vitamin B12 transporter